MCIYPELTVSIPSADREAQRARPSPRATQTLDCLVGSWGSVGLEGTSACSQQVKLASKQRVMVSASTAKYLSLRKCWGCSGCQAGAAEFGSGSWPPFPEEGQG